MKIYFKIRRKLLNLLTRFRGLVLFNRNNVFIGNNVQLLYPETIRAKGTLTLKPYTRIDSSENSIIEFGNNVTVCSFTTIESAGGNISFGNNIVVGEYSTFQGQGGIRIEDNVLLASHVHMVSNNHCYEDVNLAIRDQGNESKEIVVKENAWIGLNVVIQAGVTIGRNAVVGSGSIVRSSVPDYCVAVGVPAKVVKKYNPDLGVWERV